MKDFNHAPIPVIKTALPPLETYIAYLQGIWERRQLTNNGPLVEELEAQLESYLGVKHCLLVSSGTIALQLAIKALDLHGEVVTTPFSFVATSSALVWEGCQPIYADIDPRSLCIDPTQIEAAITSNTSAILATHIYGHPCEAEKIQAVADKYRLAVIYDAAHAFGVSYKQQSILYNGTISTLSFHATKLFYTGEGGAIICSDDQLAEKIRRMRDFGIDGPEAFFAEVGINAKMSELQAALGLCVLPTVSAAIASRKIICAHYDEQLQDSPISRPMPPPDTDYNYAYYPVLFKSEATLQKVQSALNAANIFPRRYFYPTLNRLAYVTSAVVPAAEDIASRILCLPLFVEMDLEQVDYVCRVLTTALTD